MPAKQADFEAWLRGPNLVEKLGPAMDVNYSSDKNLLDIAIDGRRHECVSWRAPPNAIGVGSEAYRNPRGWRTRQSASRRAVLLGHKWSWPRCERMGWNGERQNTKSR